LAVPNVRAQAAAQHLRITPSSETIRQDGIVIKLSCEICGSEKSEAHHDDYAAPLDVRWLCRAHHRQHHVQHGPGLNAFSEETSA